MDGAEALPPEPEVRLPERFRDALPLAAGGFGAVYRALTSDGSPVAVKVLHPRLARQPDAVWQFGAEFRYLRRAGDGLFPRALEQGLTAAGVPYYAMELVSGQAPAQLPWPARRVREVLAALAGGLAVLHGIGLVHGDIKAENVRIEPSGCVRLLDLGLVAPIGQHRAGIAGTLGAMAPEVLRQAPVEASADVYALGALAYELRTGSLPFTGPPAAVIRAHLAEAPAAPAARAIDADHDLDQLILAMLAKAPAGRPAGMAGVLAALGAPLPAGAASGDGLQEGPYVGLAALLAAWETATAGVLLLEGADGLGRTRSLDELRVAALAQETAWAGAAFAGATDAPLGPVRAALGQALATSGQARGKLLASWLAGEPVLADLEPAARLVALQAAIHEALAAATPQAGLVIALDDWHLADAASRTLLTALWRAPAIAGLRWVLAAAPGHAEGLPPGTSHHALAPLDERDGLALVEARLGAVPPDGLVARIMPLAQGSPRWLGLLLEQLVRAGALGRTPAGWHFDETASGAEAALPPSLGALWSRRLAEAGPAAAGLAAVAAAAARVGELPVPVLGAVAGLVGSELDEALQSLARLGLVRVEGGRARVTAPGLADAVAPSEAIATALARALMGERAPGDLPLDELFKAAWLSLAGDDRPLAARLVGVAGERALSAWGAADALRLLDAARERLTDVEGAERLAMVIAHAEASRFLDRTAQAAEGYEQALALARARDEAAVAARAGIGLAKCRQLQGAYAEALEGARQAGETAGAAGLGSLEARARVAEARLHVFLGDPARAMDCCRGAAEVAAAAGAPALRGEALNLLGVLWVQANPDDARQGLGWIEEAIAIARNGGDLRGEGLALDNLGNAHLALGDLPGAAAAFEAYGTLCRTLGLPTEGLSADLNRAKVAAELGEVSAARTLAADVDARAGHLGRKFPQAAAKLVRAQALWRGGDAAEARAQLDAALAIAEGLGNRYLLEHVRLYRLEAFVALGDAAAAHEERALIAGDTAETRARLACLAGELAYRNGELAEARALVEPWLESPNRWAAHAAARVLASCAAASDDARAGVPHAERALAQAEAWKSSWWVALDRALLAHVLHAAGEREAALTHARAVAARTGQADGNPFALAEAQALLAAAGEAMAAVPRAAGPDSAWRLDPAVYRLAIEELALATDEAALGQAGLRGAMQLVHADRGYMLVYEAGELRRAVTAGLDYEREVAEGFSHSIAEEALFSSEPVYVVDASADPNWKAAASVLALGLRTVVCLPLAVPERTLGLLYLDRQALEPVLGPGDMTLLAAFATAVASAILRVREGEALAREAARERRHAALATSWLACLDVPSRRRAFLQAAISLLDAEQGAWLEPTEGALTALFTLDAKGREVAYRPGAVSAGILDWVATHQTPLAILDVAADEDWQARESVQALGARTVWCVPLDASSGRVLYFDAQRVDAHDPEEALPELQALAAFAAPVLDPG